MKIQKICKTSLDFPICQRGRAFLASLTNLQLNCQKILEPLKSLSPNCQKSPSPLAPKVRQNPPSRLSHRLSHFSPNLYAITPPIPATIIPIIICNTLNVICTSENVAIGIAIIDAKIKPNTP